MDADRYIIYNYCLNDKQSAIDPDQQDFYEILKYSVHRSLFIDFWLVGGSCWLMFDRCCDRDFRLQQQQTYLAETTTPTIRYHVYVLSLVGMIDENITVILSVHNDWGIDTVLLLTHAK